MKPGIQVKTFLPSETVALMDEIRGDMSRSKMVDHAIRAWALNRVNIDDLLKAGAE